MKVSLLLKKNIKKKLPGPITSTNIMANGGLDPDGLFSVSIFGEMNTPERVRRMSYIEFNHNFMQIEVWDTVMSLGDIYKKVVTGNVKATLDENNYLVKSEDGDTGIGWFFSVFESIKYKVTDSVTRANKIKLIYDAIQKKEVWENSVMVASAGIREVIFDEDGRPSVPEINDYYRPLIVSARASSNLTKADIYSGRVDTLIYKIQSQVYALHAFIMDIAAGGKDKFLRSYVTKRVVAFKTRNVITAEIPIIKSLRDWREINYDMNTATIGLYQFCMANPMFIIPKIIEDMAEHLHGDQIYVFENGKYVQKTLGFDVDYDLTTYDGCHKLMRRLDDRFPAEMKLSGMTLKAINIDGDKVRLLKPSDSLEDLGGVTRAVTYGEYLALMISGIMDDRYGIVTRHPVTGKGSTIPVSLFVKPGNEYITVEYNGIKTRFPTNNTDDFKSMGVPFPRLAGFGGDFDGDKVGIDVSKTKDSADEIRAILNSAEYYFNQNGGFDPDFEYDVVEELTRSLMFTMKG